MSEGGKYSGGETPPEFVRIVKGDPTETELAALVASLLAAQVANTDARDDGTRSSVWADPRRRWGVPTTPNRAAWRWSTQRAW